MKKIGKRTRSMILMVTVAVFFILAYVVSSGINGDEEEASLESGETGEKVLDISPDDITQIVFSSKEDEENTDSIQDIELIKEESEWIYGADNEFPLDESKIENMVSVLSNLTSSDEIDSESVNLEDYGVDVEKSYDDIVLTVSFKAGENLYTYYVGNYNSITDGYYMVTETMDSIYMVETDIVDAFNYDLYDLLLPDEMPEINSDYLTGMAAATAEKSYIFEYEITTEAETEADTVEDTEAESDTGSLDDEELESYITWYRTVTDIETNVQGEKEAVDSSSFSQAVSDIIGIAVNEAVDYKPSDDALTEYGLIIPEYTIILTYLESEEAQEETTLTLYLGSETDEGTYMRIGDSDIILLIDTIDLSGILG